MKKNIILLAFMLLIVIIVCMVGISVHSKMNNVAKKQNKQYEPFLTSTIYGTDVVTLINKAMNNNEQNGIAKDNKGWYIPDNQNSVMIDLVMITDIETGEKKTYRMETISKAGINDFIKNFNISKFQCTKTEYHVENGKIKYIQLEQLPD